VPKLLDLGQQISQSINHSVFSTPNIRLRFALYRQRFETTILVVGMNPW